jgi:isoamylase
MFWFEGIGPGQLYAYRVDGHTCQAEGTGSFFSRPLADPFATAISRLANWDSGKALWYDPSAAERDLISSGRAD